MRCTLFHTATVTLSLALLAGSGVARADDAPTTRPASPQQLTAELTAARKQFTEVMSDPQMMSDPAKRAAEAPKALAALDRLEHAYLAIGAVQPRAAAQIKAALSEVIQYRAAFDDPTANAKLAAFASDPDPVVALKGQVSQLNVRWLQAGNDKDKQAAVVDAAEPVAKAHPESTMMTVTMARWAATAADPALADRLLADAGAMNNAAVKQVAALKQQLEGTRKIKALENKPFVMTGTTVEGKAFSTADYKGKVVLIDFWATWCGPCKAELPKVKALYQKFHDKGLEIVGVSNDYSADALTDYCAKENMPWPQLYDVNAGGDHEWNPITMGYGINAIPHMFIIGADGVLISADARATYEKVITDLLTPASK